MISKESINKSNFESLRLETAKAREDSKRQKEALSDTRLLKDFAQENEMKDHVVELYLEEALIHHHDFMERKEQSSLMEMKKAVEMAKSFVSENSLSRCESRVARFLGRVADLEGNFEKAAGYYKEAIEKAELDPKYEGNKALVYEYRGFLALDGLRLGNTNEAIEAVEKLYRDYEETVEGKDLKTKDYTTWAIWRSGVLINMCLILIDLGMLGDYRERIDRWLNMAESDISAPQGVQVWADFGFRKNEIQRVRELMV